MEESGIFLGMSGEGVALGISGALACSDKYVRRKLNIDKYVAMRRFAVRLGRRPDGGQELEGGHGALRLTIMLIICLLVHLCISACAVRQNWRPICHAWRAS